MKPVSSLSKFERFFFETALQLLWARDAMGIMMNYGMRVDPALRASINGKYTTVMDEFVKFGNDHCSLDGDELMDMAIEKFTRQKQTQKRNAEQYEARQAKQAQRRKSKEEARANIRKRKLAKLATGHSIPLG